MSEGSADPNLYPQLGRMNSQQGFNPNLSASNLQYYNSGAQQQTPAGGASIIDSLGDAAFGPMGKHVMSQFAGSQLVNENISRFMTLTPLKYYFNVNNSYVMNKIKLLLCPFFHKSWKRRIIRVGEVDSYAFPREDINAPDLYIPAMAFVSYILVVAFVYGTTAQFTPEILGITASKAMAILGFEILVLKTVFYLFNCGGVSVLDLISYCGYKFVGLVVTVLSGFMFGGYLYFLGSIYVGIVLGFFMIRTLRLVLVLEASRVIVEGPGVHTSGKNYFLLIVAAFQIIVVYFLGIVG